jgi:hypothetical protein
MLTEPECQKQDWVLHKKICQAIESLMDEWPNCEKEMWDNMDIHHKEEEQGEHPFKHMQTNSLHITLLTQFSLSTGNVQIYTLGNSVHSLRPKHK